MSTFTISDDNNIVAFPTVEDAAQTGDPTATRFDSKDALAKVSADWPMSRFIELFNSIPGNSPVKKFENRTKATARIWKAIQPLAGDGQPSEPVEASKAPVEAPVAAPPATHAPPTSEAATTEASEAPAAVPELVTAPPDAEPAKLEDLPNEPMVASEPAIDVPAESAANPKPKRARKVATKSATSANNANVAENAAAEPTSERPNKKAEVIAMMKRANGVTLAEIMVATNWQKHTIRGFVSILGGKGGLVIESSKSDAGERTYRIAN